MILMIDDVQMMDEKTFFPYVSQALGYGNDGITNADKLYDVVSEYKNELEIIIHDYDDVPDSSKKFAKSIAGVFMDSKLVNKKVKVNFLHGEENSI